MLSAQHGMSQQAIHALQKFEFFIQQLGLKLNVL